jgi:hypothetical protein
MSSGPRRSGRPGEAGRWRPTRLARRASGLHGRDDAAAGPGDLLVADAPARRSSNSWARSPPKTRWVCGSIRPGVIQRPSQSMRLTGVEGGGLRGGAGVEDAAVAGWRRPRLPRRRFPAGPARKWSGGPCSTPDRSAWPGISPRRFGLLPTASICIDIFARHEDCPVTDDALPPESEQDDDAPILPPEKVTAAPEPRLSANPNARPRTRVAPSSGPQTLWFEQALLADGWARTCGSRSPRA